jgi:signal transduction histidine kinase
MFKEKHLPKLIFITPIMTVGLLTLFILSFFIVSERANLRVESAALEEKLLQGQKTILVAEVQKIFAYFEYHMGMLNKRIDRELKDRVDDIAAMGIGLYAQYEASKALREVQRELLVMLSSLHVSGHRGYYFVVGSAGEILFPLEEAGDRVGLSEAAARALLAENGYANTDVGRPRRLYVKRLAPFGWHVGSAEYLDEATSRLKEEMIEWTQSLRYGNDGYVWIHNTTHTLLAHPFRQEAVGKDDAMLQDAKGESIVQMFVKKALQSKDDKGSFVEYEWQKPHAHVATKKLSYVALFAPWNWVVGTGVYRDDVEREIASKKEEMKEKMDRYIAGVIIIALFSMLAVGFLSFMVTQQINEALESYRKRVKAKTEALREFNATLRSKVAKALEESKQKDKALLQQSRLAQMGEMLSLIAHQWRQPLSEVSAIFMELESASKFGKASREMIAYSAQEADKLLCYMSRTIDDFRHFFKPSKDKEHFCIHDACQEALSLSSALLKNAHIDLHVTVESHTDVEGYPNEYAQVVLNLLINAKEALQSRKTPNPSIVLEVTQTKEGKSCVRISDNAGGIEPSVRDALFEPYVSTKTTSGSGLGLYMSKMIIEQNMGGKLSVTNTEEGACFCIEV